MNGDIAAHRQPRFCNSIQPENCRSVLLSCSVHETVDVIGIRKGAFSAAKCGCVERIDTNQKMDRVVGKTRWTY